DADAGFDCIEARAPFPQNGLAGAKGLLHPVAILLLAIGSHALARDRPRAAVHDEHDPRILGERCDGKEENSGESFHDAPHSFMDSSAGCGVGTGFSRSTRSRRKLAHAVDAALPRSLSWAVRSVDETGGI